MIAAPNLLGAYRPTGSPLHSLPVGVKLAGLAVAGLAAGVLRGVPSTVALLALALVLTAVGRVALHTLRGLLPVVVIAAAMTGYHWWQGAPARGLELGLDLVALVLLAVVLTATTSVDALLDTLVRGLRALQRVPLVGRFVDPDAVALAVALMLRTIPALWQVHRETRDAARARGLERSPRAYAVPLAVRTVARAHTTGDALRARGLAD
ncbi:MAG: energy-coupling factor transporter transmembrane component T [Cellulomonadaceae bacterium]